MDRIKFNADMVVKNLLEVLPDYRPEKHVQYDYSLTIISFWRKGELTRVDVNNEQVHGRDKEIEKKLKEVLLMSGRWKKNYNGRRLFNLRKTNGLLTITHTAIDKIIIKKRVK